MKILIICTAFPRNKKDVITPWLVKFIKELERKNNKFFVFTSSYKGIKQRKFNNIRIIRFRYFFSALETLTHDLAVPEKLKESPGYYLLIPFYITGGIIKIFLSHKYFKKQKIDVIHVHWPIPHVIFGLLLKTFLKKPLICTFHSAEIVLLKNLSKIPVIGKLFNLFFEYLFKKTDFVTVNSSYTKNLLKNIKIPENKIKIIPFGTTLDKIEKTSSEKKYKKQKKILFVGRLVERKGVEFLIRAFEKISTNFPDYKLHIVGEGPLYDKLKNLTKKLNITNKVKFLGFIDEARLKEEYLTSDIFVLPAIIDSRGDTEGLGVVIIEAMHYGLPVIASSVGGIPDIVKNRYNGILVKEKDIEGLSKAIIELLENTDLKKELSKNAKIFIKNYFSWNRITEEFENLYKMSSVRKAPPIYRPQV